jgi:beta-lactamase regulating signal transducer with metallopeptidase domain
MLPLVALLDAVLPMWTGAVAGVVESRDLVITAATSKVEQRNMAAILTMLGGVVLLVSFCLQGWRLLRQLLQLRRIINDATPLKRIHGLQLLVSSAITAPFSTRVLGTRQVVLPSDLLVSPRNLQLAVKHELQHVRNHDLEWVIALEAIKVLCNWNPAAWLWHNEFDCLQEFACDEVLVSERHVSREGYGHCLLEVAGTANGIALLAASNMVPKFSFWQNNQQQLKRRILMLMIDGRCNSKMKSLCYGALIAAGLLVEAGVVAGAEQQSSPDVIPVDRTTSPGYPATALAEKKEGWVQLGFGIDAAGNVLNPKVVDHCVWVQGGDPKNCEKSDLFDASSVAALSTWKYASGSAREGVQTILKFQMGPEK